MNEIKMKTYKWVVVKHPGNIQPFLFYAPAGVGIKKGDTVFCDTHKGIQEGTVVAEFECDKRDLAFQVVADICGDKKGDIIRPIESVVKRVKLYYTEENNEDITYLWYSNSDKQNRSDKD